MSTQINYRTIQEALQPAEIGPIAPLGTTMRTASPCLAEKGQIPRGKQAKQGENRTAENDADSFDFRDVRWALQSAARAIIGKGAINYCLRVKLPDRAEREVWRHLQSEKHHYGGMCVCASVWSCAPCANKISEGRRVELKEAMNHADQYSFSMVTLTVSHKLNDPLETLLNNLLASYRRMTSGKAYQSFIERCGIVGSIKSLEVTYTDRNGFHPHLHILMVTKRGAKIDKRWLKAKWQRVIAANHLTADYHIGCDFRQADMSAAEYVEKYGHERIKDWWGASGEMTKGVVKLSRDAKGYSMFQVLYNSMRDPDQKRQAHWRGVFLEYARAFKGKRQLTYSAGLRALLGLTVVEKTDKEIAEGLEKPSELIATLSDRQWRIIIGNDARGELLNAADKGGIDAFNDYLRSIGAQRTIEENYRYVLDKKGQEHLKTLVDNEDKNHPSWPVAMQKAIGA